MLNAQRLSSGAAGAARGQAPCARPAAPHAAPSRPLVAARAEASNGAYDGNPIMSGPISVGVGAAASDVAAEKGAKPVDRSKGLWTRCDKCGVILYVKHLKEHHHICFGCNYHLKMTSQERIEHLIDPGTWRPLDETLSPMDPLEFTDQK
ncbi:acetyl-CoA carboxylase subunit beta [Monoraphidium neglectum]|uniref:Acetyl-CoA carboxylase subunit beta n=1 Tax=Monoraphidium neglectum TaxID=145388 RepID=A0A0D2KHA0_9CHLO|nr:acetyl-CoA carboxylase subunit beta [Monoraphidium neglectum]KIY95133.1 acetyl-CoA carboxylase subunit beta [Monoraphidium neglectum]|eukprot:XP_013894153.1 acetyl-CoA carboxylase subunit beta [Monoraphidium neglectum]